MYEVQSESDFSSFRPNWYVDIKNFYYKKIEIMEAFNFECLEYARNSHSELCKMGMRGSAVNCHSAEAFEIIYNKT